MNISTVNTGYGYYQAQDISDKSKNQMAAKAEQVRAERQTQTATVAEGQNYTNKPDLENITPKETYELAVGLLESETISLGSYVKMMAIGLNQEYPPGEQVDKSNPGNAPFNLLQQLDDMAAGTHEHFTAESAGDKTEIETLVEILKGLPAQIPQAKGNTLSISV